jgi:hypothetical protein
MVLFMANFGGSPLKMQIVGHSFVTRLKDFIRSGDGVDFFLNLRPSDYLIQFSGFPGATVGKLREQLDVVSDFQPDIVFLLVGTNDLYNDSVATTAQKIGPKKKRPSGLNRYITYIRSAVVSCQKLFY